MSNKVVFKNKFFLLVAGYLLLTLAGFWVLTKSWLPPDFILAGHDSGLALDAKNFLETRLYAWDDHINFGQDNTLNFGSITLHFIDYVLSFLSGDQSAGNQVAIFFWLTVLFSSALIFSLSLREYFGKVFIFLFPVFVTFNFYVFQSMFMLERAKYGLFAATMLFTAIIFKVLEKKMPILLGVMLSSMIFFIFNGGSLWGLPLYGGLLVMLIVLLVHTTIWGFLTKNANQIYRLLAFLFLTAIGYILINSYAIFPYFIKFSRGGASALFNQETIAPNKAWLDYISQASSFINVLRLQGIPDWYDDKFSINPNHPYAQSYTEKPLLVLVSFLLPLLAFLSLLLTKTTEQKRLISFFALVVLVSLVFVAGTHAPLGFIYTFLYEKIPGFVIFRTPFYKFGSVFFLGMLVLIAFTLSSFINKLTNAFKSNRVKVFTSFLLTMLIIFSWLAYHRVLLSSEVLNWQKDYTTKIKVPRYVQDFKVWAENNDIAEGRILLLPPLDEGWKIDSYRWGYWSLSPLPSMFVFENAVVNDVSLTQEERNWLWELYPLIETGKEEEVINLSRRLGVNSFLVRKDVSVNNPLFNLKSPGDFETILSSFKNINKVASFGEWVVFKIISEPYKKFYATSSLVEIPQNQLFFYRDFAKKSNTFLREKQSVNVPNKFFSAEFKSSQCESCLIEEVETNTVLPVVRVLPNSPLYVLKKFRERTELLSTTTEEEKINTYLGFTLRRASEVKNMLDFRAREKYLLEDLKAINDYLIIVYQILSSLSDQKNDFEQARRVIKTLHPIEANFRIEVDKAKSGTFSEGVIQRMTDVLWQIHRIKNLYSEILGDQERWANEKVYKINLSDRGTDRIFLATSFLPFDKDGNRVYPKEAILMKNGQELPLKIIPQTSDFLEMVIPENVQNEARLSVRFANPPNKFNFQSFRIEETPRGLVNCYYGSVKRFDKTLNYKIKVSASARNQFLKLFIREEAKDNQELQYFLKGQREIDIFPILSYEPFTVIYNPSTNLDYLGLYVCSENKELPQVLEVFVEEIFSPTVVVSQTTEKVFNSNLPRVIYEEISPVKYEVTLEGGEIPFILVFNERYDSLWQIREINNTPISQDKHFIVDGYSNGWEIDELGSGKFALEYTPQKAFNLGVIVSLTFGILSLFGTILFVKRGAKQNENK